MSSILLTTYDALESMAVSYLDKNSQSANPTVYNLDTLPGSIQTAHLPCRLLLPLGQGQGGTRTGTIFQGAGIRANWEISDLFLLETVAQERGVYVHAPVLMRYCAAYAEAVSKIYNIISGQHTLNEVQSVSLTPGVYEYPAGSGAFFYGVKADIVVEETF